MELQYTNKIEANKAYILLNEEITVSYANYLTQEMYFHASQGRQIELKINSVGGSIFGGYSIIDAVKTTEADTNIIGIAASMAGIIALYGKKRKASQYAVLMAHPPQGEDSDLKELVRNGLKANLTNRSKFTEEEITNILNQDKEVFFDVSQMLEKGLIDEVEEDQMLMPVEASQDVSNMYELFNKQIINKEVKKMDLNAIKNTLDLAGNASEEKVIETIGNLKNSLSEKAQKVADLESDKKELTNTIATLEGQIEKERKAKVESLLNQFKDVVSEENKAKFEKLANADFDLAQSTLETLKNNATGVSPFDLINQSGGQKSYSQMTEQERTDLARTNPELYNKLVEKEYK